MKRSFKCRKRRGHGPAGKIDNRGGGKGKRSGVMRRLLRCKLALRGKQPAHGIARSQLRRLRISTGRGKRIDGGGRRDHQLPPKSRPR